MHKRVSVSILAAGLALIAGTAGAQAVRSEKNISLDLANQIAAGAVTACAAIAMQR